MDIQPELQSLEISIELGNSILQYLGNRPYVEVAGLIQQLQIAANMSVDKKRNEDPTAAAAKGDDQNEQ